MSYQELSLPRFFRLFALAGAFAGCASLALAAPQAEKQQEQEQEQEEKKPDEQQEPIQGPSITITVEESIREVPTESTTAAKMAVPLMQTPASVGIVTHSLIESQDGVVLADAIRNVSGVNVGTGFGIFDFFTIRGFDNLTGGLVLTDGAREPESTYYQLYNVDRVEVLKGPSSFLWGANSLSGTVNLVRKRPLFTGNFGEVDFSFGSFQNILTSFDLNVADSAGDVAFRFNGIYQDAENYRDDKDSYLGAFNPAFTWRLSERSDLTINFEYVKNEFKPDVGLPLFFNQIPQVDRKNSYQAPFDISRQEIARFRADWTYRLSDTATFHNKFYRTSLDWRSDGTLFIGAFPNQTGSVDVFRVFSALDDLQVFTGNQSELVFTFGTGALRHQVLLGLELADLDDQFTLDNFFLPSIDLFNPVETANPAFLFPIPGQSSVGDARSIVVAPYFLDQISFAESVQVFAGGRFDYIDHEDPANGISRNDGNFSPLAGIVVSPVEQVSIYASGGKAFRPPSTLILEQDRQPEESTQYEVGLKNEFLDGRILTTLAYYHLERQNIAIFDDNGITQQSGDQRSRGVEFDISAEVLPDWYHFFSYAFTDAELTDFNELVQVSQNPPQFLVLDRSGNTPAFAPEHLLNYWTMKRFSNGLGLGFGVRYVSEQFIAEDNGFAIDDYVLLDATASFQRRGWRFAVNFKNLGDKDYETRGFGAASILPANPFAVYGSVSYSFGF